MKFKRFFLASCISLSVSYVNCAEQQLDYSTKIPDIDVVKKQISELGFGTSHKKKQRLAALIRQTQKHPDVTSKFDRCDCNLDNAFTYKCIASAFKGGGFYVLTNNSFPTNIVGIPIILCGFAIDAGIYRTVQRLENSRRVLEYLRDEIKKIS